MNGSPVAVVADGPPSAARDRVSLTLVDYEKIKFELADIVRLASTKISRNSDPLYANFLEFFARLAEDRFNLVVAGRFSRGKTSLMNAILGTDRLPTGIVPLTSVITSVGYGSSERVDIEFQRSHLPLAIGMDELSQYITERGNPGNTRGIRQAKIELPAEILRRGFYFIDTPGLGSSIAENTRTAMGFLPEADALVLVSGYDSPLSEEELRVLQGMANTTTQVFFVLNKQDTVAPEARLEVTQYVTQQLARIFGDRPPLIFSTSAVDALAAKLGNHPERLAATGLPELEAALTLFLIENKSRHFLLRMLDRASTLVNALAPDADIAALKGRIEQLRSGIDGNTAKRAGSQGLTLSTSAVFGPIAKVRHCAVCERINSEFFEFLCHYQHALVTYAQDRARFVANDGFCARHFWLYAAIAAPRDICVSLAPLLSKLSAELSRRAEPPQDSLSPARPPSHAEAACPLCAIQRDIEHAEVARLNARGPGNKSSVIAELPSLCIPHLRSLSEELDNQDLTYALFASHSQAAERLAEDMRRYALKHDGLRRALTSDEETSASKDAIAYVAGHRSIIR